MATEASLKRGALGVTNQDMVRGAKERFLDVSGVATGLVDKSAGSAYNAVFGCPVRLKRLEIGVIEVFAEADADIDVGQLGALTEFLNAGGTGAINTAAGSRLSIDLANAHLEIDEELIVVHNAATGTGTYTATLVYECIDEDVTNVESF